MNGAQVGTVQQLTTTPGQVSSGAAASAGDKTGVRAGQTVTVANPPSIISQALNASEELTMNAHRQRKPSEFKVSKGKSDSERQLEFIKKIKMVEDIQGVEDFKKNFPKQANPDLKRDEYLEKAGEHFPDPYHRYVALQELAVDYDAQSGDEIFQAIDALEQKYPQCVGLGKEISRAVELLEGRHPNVSFSEIGQEVSGQVNDYQTLSKVFASLQDTTDAGAFTKSVDAELRKLSNQLNSMTAATGTPYLRSVINDMTALKRVVGMHDNCMDTQEQILRPPQSMKQFDGHQYMQGVLTILDRQFVNSSDFHELFHSMGTEALTQKLFLANKTGFLVRDLPEEIFANAHVKEGIAQIILEIQDELVLEEEGIKSEGKGYGQIGEQEISLDGFVHSGDILGDLGVDLTGRSQSGKDDKVTQSTRDPVVDNSAEPPGQEGSEPIVSADKARGAAPTATPKDNFDGLNDQQLISKQDELLQQARALQQQKDKDYVSGSSLTALNHALSGGTDVLPALENITRQRGSQFAKGLKIAIKPQGSDAELQLIPPDKKALQAWAGQEGNNLDELVRTAVTVLEKNRDASFDPEKVAMEFASLKEAIGQIDSKIKKKPLLRDMGEAVFNRLEDAHKFTVRADQGAVSVEALVPKEEAASPARAKAGITANGAQNLPGVGVSIQTPAEGWTRIEIQRKE